MMSRMKDMFSTRRIDASHVTGGALTLRDLTATTGNTKLILRNGDANEAAIFSANVFEHQRQNGTLTCYIRNDGLIGTAMLECSNGLVALSDQGGDANRNRGLNMSNDVYCGVTWTNGGSWYGTKDIGLYRGGAGIIDVTNGLPTAFGGTITGTMRAGSYVCVSRSAAPSSPAAGEIYFDSDDAHFYGWDGSTWKQLDN